MAPPTARRGAYGLLLDHDVPPDLLSPAGHDWVPWRLLPRLLDPRSEPTTDDVHVSTRSACLPLLGGGWVEIDRATARTHAHLPHLPSGHHLAHPLPATTAAVVAWWAGRQALHGTAVGRDGRAVAVLGTRRRGKSTTSLRLLDRGFDLVADDLLVVQGTTVVTGTRTLDLRRSSAHELGAGTDVGRIGSRERWRVVAPDCPPAHTLVGVVELEWGDDLEVTPLGVSERFAALVRHRTLPLLPPLDPAAVLDTLSVPFVRLRRRRSLDQLDPAIDAVLAQLGLSPAPRATPSTAAGRGTGA